MDGDINSLIIVLIGMGMGLLYLEFKLTQDTPSIWSIVVSEALSNILIIYKSIQGLLILEYIRIPKTKLIFILPLSNRISWVFPDVLPPFEPRLQKY